MKKTLIKILLGILNSSWLNQTPCKYEFVGNITAFSRDYLQSSVRQEPHLLVRDLLNQEMRPITPDDIKDLQTL